MNPNKGNNDPWSLLSADSVLKGQQAHQRKSENAPRKDKIGAEIRQTVSQKKHRCFLFFLKLDAPKENAKLCPIGRLRVMVTKEKLYERKYKYY